MALIGTRSKIAAPRTSSVYNDPSAMSSWCRRSTTRTRSPRRSVVACSVGDVPYPCGSD